MDTIIIPLLRLAHSAGLDLPASATIDSAGMDLSAAIEQPITLLPLQRHLIPTGFSMALPKGYEAQIRPRSGLALKHGITVLNSPGTIDADYRGEIKVLLVNISPDSFTVERGMRIAQMVVAPYVRLAWEAVTTFDDIANERLSGGFGSTGLF